MTPSCRPLRRWKLPAGKARPTDSATAPDMQLQPRPNTCRLRLLTRFEGIGYREELLFVPPTVRNHPHATKHRLIAGQENADFRSPRPLLQGRATEQTTLRRPARFVLKLHECESFFAYSYLNAAG